MLSINENKPPDFLEKQLSPFRINTFYGLLHNDLFAQIWFIELNEISQYLKQNWKFSSKMFCDYGAKNEYTPMNVSAVKF